MKSKKLITLAAILIVAILAIFFIVKCGGDKSEPDTAAFRKIDSLAQIKAKQHYDSAAIFFDSSVVGQNKLDSFRANPSAYDRERHAYDSLIRAKVLKNRQLRTGAD